MIFFQWATLPEDRQHATIKALYDGTIRLCLSEALFSEVRDVLSRPELAEKFPALTAPKVQQVLAATLERAEWFANVPPAFTWTVHPDDDHLFNLAIAARAKFLVTWESRLLKLSTETTDDAKVLRSLAPDLKIITPPQLAELLKK